MQKRTYARIGRLGASALLTGGIVALVVAFQPTPSVGQAAASAGNMPGFNDDFAKLGIKFEGAASCSNAQCHGADEPQEGKGATTLAEFTQWSAADKHAKAYETLNNEESAKITEALTDYEASAKATEAYAEANKGSKIGSSFVNDAKSFLVTAKQLMRRVRDKVPYSQGDKMILQTGSGAWMVEGSPARMMRD